MRKFWSASFIFLVIALTLTACGSSSNLQQQQAKPGTVYLIGTDAPMPSVVAFELSLDSLTLSDGTTSQPVVAEKSTIEWSRLLGMRTLLGMNTIPAGTYTSATLKVSSPVISYLDLTTTPASIGTINGTLTQDTFTINFGQPLVVGESGLAGVHMHFLLNKSLEVDGQGNLTGKVTPVIFLKPLKPTDDDSEIDELRGGLSSVDIPHNSFVLQGPLGRQVTIITDSNTQWQNGESISTLSQPAVIQISGKVQADRTILADAVEIIARDRFLLGGLVLDTSPASGTANDVTLLVREEWPDFQGINVGRTATIDFDSNNPPQFGIWGLGLPVDFLLFNQSSLTRGQRILMGGTYDTSTNPATLHPRRVVLHVQGIQGALVANSVQVNHGNDGTFQINNNGLFGYLFAGAPINVTTSVVTRFGGGITGLADLKNASSMNVRVVGLLLRTANGPILAAWRVDQITQ